MKLKIIKFKNFNKYPERKHYNDAGLDCYLPEKVIMPPHTTKAIGLGFGINLPDGFVGFVFPRSGTSQEGIVTELSPIDSGYKGEIHAIITNLTGNTKMLQVNERVGQLVILPCVLPELVDDLGEERDKNWSNSTGK